MSLLKEAPTACPLRHSPQARSLPPSGCNAERSNPTNSSQRAPGAGITAPLLTTHTPVKKRLTLLGFTGENGAVVSFRATVILLPHRYVTLKARMVAGRRNPEVVGPYSFHDGLTFEDASPGVYNKPCHDQGSEMKMINNSRMVFLMPYRTRNDSSPETAQARITT